jgi:glycerol uptake facilitator protein
MRRKTLAGELFAEFVGTTFLLMLGLGIVAQLVYGTRLGKPAAAPFSAYDWNTNCIGWGFTVAIAVYIAGGITGAHINPAVTLAAILRGTIAVGKGLAYMVVQVAGAFVGAFLAHLVYYGNFINDGYQNIFYTTPAPGYENLVWNNYFVEILATFVLLVGVYAIVDNVRNVGPGANLWPFMIGILIITIGFTLGGPTGYSLNPARDFGPRVYAALVLGDREAFGSGYWLAASLGPFIGAPLGAFFYDFALKPLLPDPAEAEPAPEGADVTHAPARERTTYAETVSGTTSR